MCGRQEAGRSAATGKLEGTMRNRNNMEEHPKLKETEGNHQGQRICRQMRNQKDTKENDLKQIHHVANPRDQRENKGNHGE